MANNGLQQAISYKDPAGFVVKLQDGFYRLITYGYAAEFDHLLESGLYQTLIDKGLMVSHKEVPLGTVYADCYKKIYPQQLNFISYPFEWSYTQWQQMILTYININKIALKHGMILKDATPYNFVFYNNKCILIDTLSFSFYGEKGAWLAYRQFCEEILSPFLLMYYKDPAWVKLYRASINGLPLSFVSRQLPFKTRFNLFCLIHIHLHAKFQSRTRAITTSNTTLNKDKLQALFDVFLKNTLKRQQPKLKNSIWDDYYANNIESEFYLKDKVNIITRWLTQVKPGITVDLGANTGKFSFIAAMLSKHVYALESDVFCIDELHKNISNNKEKNITAIVADITDPSPGLGWANDEKTPLLRRIQCDTLMALALIHHLCLSKNIPLHFIAKLFSDITSHFAIVEFVPKSDPKSQILLKHKGDIFEQYTEEEFVRSFEKYFTLVASHTCDDSVRKLFLWEKT